MDKSKHAMTFEKTTRTLSLTLAMALLMAGALVTGFLTGRTTTEPAVTPTGFYDAADGRHPDAIDAARRIWAEVVAGHTTFTIEGDHERAQAVLECAGLSPACSIEATTLKTPIHTWTECEISPQDAVSLVRTRIAAVEFIKDSPVNILMPKREIANILAHRLMEICAYDDAHEMGSAFDAFTGLATCAGYSQAYDMLLGLCGIHARYAFGTVNDANYPNHMWNVVEIDGRQLHTDVTWADGGRTDDYLFSGEVWEDHTLERID